MTPLSSHFMRVLCIAALLVSPMLIAQNPVPFLTQPLIPAAIAPAPPGLTLALTVNGTGFVPGATVNWNGHPRRTLFIGNSRLVAFVLSSDIAVPTTAWITVSNPSPGGGTSNTLWLPVNRSSRSVSFYRQDYPVGYGPAFPTAFDVNGDGILDLAVPTNINGGGQVSFMLGDGDGTFHNGDTYQMGWGTVLPLFADFNRDAVTDLALAVHSPSAVAVLLGGGNGTFGVPAYYATGANPTWEVPADFNQDGKLDLATVNQAGGDSVSILLGNGDGSFQPHVDYPLGPSNPTVIAAGDFNRDGNLDLVVANWLGNVASVLLGNGDGTFRPHVDYPAGAAPGGVVVADINGDGKLDIAIANQDEASISVLLGNGDGTFRQQVKYPTAGGAIRSDFADFNDDGKIDLAVETYSNTVDILLGNGDGSFQSPTSFAVAGGPFGITAADFNGDGRMDVVITSAAEGSISVLIAQPAVKSRSK